MTRQSRQRSWAQSIGYQPVEVRRGRVFCVDVTSQLWRWQVTEAEVEEAKLFQLLPLVSLSRNSYGSLCVFSFRVVVGGGKNQKKDRCLLVRRILENGAASPLEVCEQGFARSFYDFGANTPKSSLREEAMTHREDEYDYLFKGKWTRGGIFPPLSYSTIPPTPLPPRDYEPPVWTSVTWCRHVAGHSSSGELPWDKRHLLGPLTPGFGRCLALTFHHRLVVDCRTLLATCFLGNPRWWGWWWWWWWRPWCNDVMMRFWLCGSKRWGNYTYS